MPKTNARYRDTHTCTYTDRNRGALTACVPTFRSIRVAHLLARRKNQSKWKRLNELHEWRNKRIEWDRKIEEREWEKEKERASHNSNTTSIRPELPMHCHWRLTCCPCDRPQLLLLQRCTESRKNVDCIGLTGRQRWQTCHQPDQRCVWDPGDSSSISIWSFFWRLTSCGDQPPLSEQWVDLCSEQWSLTVVQLAVFAVTRHNLAVEKVEMALEGICRKITHLLVDAPLC